MVVFAVIQLVLSSGLGYYWNALQGLLSGIVNEGDAANIVGTAIVFVLIFAPIAVFAFFGVPDGRRFWVRPLLAIPALVYIVSMALEIQKIIPLKEKFKDIYASLDNAIYIPFIIAYICLGLYYCLVIAFPSGLVTKGVGIFTMVISIGLYVAIGVYAAYVQTMNILDGTFGAWHFILYLVCLGLDAATYFLILSILMSYCAMCRDERLLGNAALAERAASKDEDDWYEDEDAYDEEPYGDGEYEDGNEEPQGDGEYEDGDEGSRDAGEYAGDGAGAYTDEEGADVGDIESTDEASKDTDDDAEGHNGINDEEAVISKMIKAKLRRRR
jgi:hypothetical protein